VGFQATRHAAIFFVPYFSASDSPFYTVSTIFFIETVQTVLSGADMYFWFVSGFGKVDRLSSFVTAFFAVPIIEAVVSLIVQFFYAYRIWLLSAKKSRWLCLIICLVGRPQSPSNVRSLMPSFLRSYPSSAQQGLSLAASM
jgi:hypothetical protein